MDPRNAAMRAPDPDAVEFVRFCYRRRRAPWPELYDEMCAVAGRGLFRGYRADDLAELGIGFSLFDMPALAVLAGRIVAEEQALRRPVRATIPGQGAEAGGSEGPTGPNAAGGPAGPNAAGGPAGPNGAAGPVRAHESAGADKPANERTFDVPIRFTVVPAGV